MADFDQRGSDHTARDRELLEVLKKDSLEHAGSLVHGQETDSNPETAPAEYGAQWIQDKLAAVKPLISSNTEVWLAQENELAKADASRLVESDYKLYQALQTLSELGICLDEAEKERAECLKVLRESSVFREIVSLIGHKNSDISSAVLSMLGDLDQKPVLRWVAGLFGNGLLRESFTRHVVQASEDDSRLVAAFGVLDRLIENSNGSVCKQWAGELPIADLAEKLVSGRDHTDPVRLNALEYLIGIGSYINPHASLMDALLVLLSKTRRAEFKELSPDDQGFLDDVVQLLEILLASPEWQQLFVDAEGIELMLMLASTATTKNGRRWQRDAAYNILLGCLTSEEFAKELVQRGILKPLVKSINWKKSAAPGSSNDLPLQILAALLDLLAPESDEWLRVYNKLVANDYKNLARVSKLGSDNVLVEDILASITSSPLFDADDYAKV